MGEYTEFAEKTLDDAITAACQKFSVTSDRLDYIVVDQGSAGFLGFNARKAVIKARVKEEAPKDYTHKSAESTKNSAAAAAPAKKPRVLTADEIDKKAEEAAARRAQSGEGVSASDDGKGEERARRSERRSDRQRGRGRRSDFRDRAGRDGRYSRDAQGSYRGKKGADAFLSGAEDVTADAAQNTESAPQEIPASRYADEPKVNYTDEQIEEAKKRAEDFLHSVFTAMGMQVEIKSDFDRENNILLLDFSGDDMGVLIGKRGQTLDSIQYLASLIVNKDIEGYIHVKADTENYRERRKKTLENLAHNIAFKVKRTRRSVALEPMNPYERRIIHSALQGDRYVTTYSEGEDPYRKVVITLKK